MNKAWVRPTSYAPGFTNNRHLSLANYRRATARQQTEVNKVFKELKCQPSWKLLAYIVTGSAVVVIFIIIILMATFFVGGADEIVDSKTTSPRPPKVAIVSDFNVANKIQQISSTSKQYTTSSYNEIKSTEASTTVSTTTTTTESEEIASPVYTIAISTSDGPLSRVTIDSIMTSTENVMDQTITASPTTTLSAPASLVEMDSEEPSTTVSTSSTTPEIQTSSLTTTSAFTSATPNFDNVQIDNTGWNPIPEEAFYTWLASGSSKSEDSSKKSTESTFAENVVSTTWKSIDETEVAKRVYIGAEVLSQNSNAAKYDNIQLADDILSVFKESTSTVSTSTLENIMKTELDPVSSSSSSVSSTSQVQPSTFDVQQTSDLNSSTNRQMVSTPIENTQTELYNSIGLRSSFSGWWNNIISIQKKYSKLSASERKRKHSKSNDVIAGFENNCSYTMNRLHQLVRVSCRSQRVPLSLVRRWYTVRQHNLSNYLEINTENNTPIKLSLKWLRDNCCCPICKHPETDLKLYVESENQPLLLDSQIKNETLHLSWQDGHKTSLRLSSLLPNFNTFENHVNIDNKTLWDKVTAEQIPFARLKLPDLLSSNEAVAEILTSILRYGIAIVEDVPPTSIDTKLVMQRMGSIHRTFWGEIYHVVADLDEFAHPSYTGNAVLLHTDTCYYYQGSGLQAFHVLKHVGDGGINHFVDGFHVATKIKKNRPDVYDYLSKTPVPFKYDEEGRRLHLINEDYIIKHDKNDKLIQTRYTPYDLDTFRTVPQQSVSQFYRCLEAWKEELNREENKYWFHLKPGTVLITDNWRIFHGRSSFTGQRTLCGMYITRNDFLSKARLLNLI
ncbi:hypothetical protein CHUAL_006577 [Chamberlinius hualienensis]